MSETLDNELMEVPDMVAKHDWFIWDSQPFPRIVDGEEIVTWRRYSLMQQWYDEIFLAQWTFPDGTNGAIASLSLDRAMDRLAHNLACHVNGWDYENAWFAEERAA